MNMEIHLKSLRGQVERVTYYNNENDYAVLKARVYGRRDLVTVVGTISAPTPGEVLSMTGEWTYHSTFGEQFKISFYTCSVPATIAGIEKYLGSGLIKGIGSGMSKRIVAKFGEKTLDVIEESPDRLLEVEGIGKLRIEMISKAWVDQKEIRSVMVFLQSNGVSSTYASKIYKRYGNESINVVKENPYRLAHDIWGIGFLTADKIARNLGFDENSPQRAGAGIMFTLQKTTEEGHVFFVRDELISKTKELLQIDAEVLDASLEDLQNEGRIVLETLDDSINAVYLSTYYAAEVRIAQMLMENAKTPGKLKEIYPTPCIRYAQKKLQIELAARQIDAVESAITNKITIITGGPGTGKTTITKAILEIWSLVTNKIILTAPTGRAAKRMSETTGKESKTIHRLLEFSPIDGKFKRNEKNHLNCDVIVIDEASMIDNSLMYHLLKAIPKTSVIILIGDINQLPSVGAGNVLKDIICSSMFSVIELNEIFRQAQSSQIVVTAHKIMHGNFPKIENSGDTDFYFIEEEDQEKTLEKIISMVKDRIPLKFGYSAINDIQVLTPMNKGVIGTNKLNESLQNALNPSGDEITRAGRTFREGDKVMQIRNNYDKDVYNGDIGFIKQIDKENQVISVGIDNKDINYEYAELDELVLAYAVSIHKSQGSEYPVVIMPLSMSHYMMLQRNLVYTGITRGKKLVIVVGTKKAMFLSIKNNKVAYRNTWLQKRLSPTKEIDKKIA